MVSTEKMPIITDNGERVEVIAPVVISASRSTDIPAFYAKWFFNRLAKGYCVWINPFNQLKQYVSFVNCKVIVFWTKNPSPIIPYLHILNEMGIHYYFQVTLNDYVKERLEPNLPSLEKRIETFKKLSSVVGPDRVIWRFDPILICPEISPRIILSKIWRIGNQLEGSTKKFVFSFVDIKAYRKVRNNLVKETRLFNIDNVDKGEGDEFQRMEIIEGLVKIRDIWKQRGWDLALATCAESVDLEEYGIEHNRCIDERLMEKIFADDKELVYYLRTGKLVQPNLFGEMPDLPETYRNLRDRGQRKLCGCMISKDIGMYNTCRHFCAYCYANTSKKIVIENEAKHFDESESLIN
ncbi:MAG: DUF1848 domain-containing protein [Clostridium sp.]|nr:DUF1848 domain-containing protein [Clostridium sp.]